MEITCDADGVPQGRDNAVDELPRVHPCIQPGRVRQRLIALGEIHRRFHGAVLPGPVPATFRRHLGSPVSRDRAKATISFPTRSIRRETTCNICTHVIR